MKQLNFLVIILLVLVLTACSTDDHDLDETQSSSVTQDGEVDETPQTSQNTESSEEQTPFTSEEETVPSENTSIVEHYYELTFTGGPRSGTTVSDSVAIENGMALYSTAEGPEVVSITIYDGEVLLQGLLTRFNTADSFPIVEGFRIEKETAAQLFFSIGPTTPSPEGYYSQSGTLELSNLEIYNLQGLDLATLKITFEGSFEYIVPSKEMETVLVSGSITVQQLTFQLPSLDIPDQNSMAEWPKPE